MKKITSILLLFILVYNMIGYYVFVAIQQAEVKRAFSVYKTTLSDEDLLVFKVPVPLYHQNDRGFEMAEGQFEAGGRVYEMVKQRLKNDTLYVYCFNDVRTEKLHSALSEHTQKHVIDFNGKTVKKENNPVKTFIKEYLPFTTIAIVANFACFHLEQQIPVHPDSEPNAVSTEISSPPPELA